MRYRMGRVHKGLLKQKQDILFLVVKEERLKGCQEKDVLVEMASY